jgi:large subunit ribosomal protein L29
MLEVKDLKNQTLDELRAQIRDLSREIFEIKTEFSITRKLEKPHLLRTKKRDRARLMTVMNQKAPRKNPKKEQGKA